MLLSPSLSALLAVLLLCGGQTLILASPMYLNFHKPSEFATHAFQAGLQDYNYHDLLPRFDIESAYEQVHQGSGFGYPLPSHGRADGFQASAQNLDPYGHQPAPNRGFDTPVFGWQHQAPALSPPRQEPEPHHGSGSGGSASLEGLDPYVVDLLTPGQKPPSSRSGSLDPSTALPPPWHSTTPSYFDGDGTPESTQRWSNQVLPAEYTQPAQLEREAPSSRRQPGSGGLVRSPALAPPRQVSTPSNSGRVGMPKRTQHGSNPYVPAEHTQARQLERGATSSRKQPEGLEGSQQSYAHSQPVRTVDRASSAARDKFKDLDRVDVPDRDASFDRVDRVEGHVEFRLGTKAQKGKIRELFYERAKPGQSMEWLAHRPVPWKSDAKKLDEMVRSLDEVQFFRKPPPLMPYVFNDHLIHFSRIGKNTELFDAFAIPFDRNSNQLEEWLHQTTYLGTIKYTKEPAKAKATGA